MVQPENSGVCQSCGLSPYLFSIVINNIIEYLDTEETFPGDRELKIYGIMILLYIFHNLWVTQEN